jgi:predicted transcriptional regulator
MIKDIMRKRFVFFQADDRLKHIIRTFAEKRVCSAPVFEDGEFIGIVYEAHLIRYFKPKKFLFWNPAGEIDVEKIKNIIAKDLVLKPTMVLKPEQKVVDLLDQIVREPSCIPVMDKGQLVGIVRREDLVIRFLLDKFARAEADKLAKSSGENGAGKRGKMQTEVDRILKLVEEDGEISARRISKEIGISVKTVESLAESLERHHLIKVKYTWFGGMMLGRMDHV